MQRNQKAFCIAVFFLVGCFLRLAFASPDGVPTMMPGGKYKASPSTLLDGETDVFRLDANGNLKVVTVPNNAVAQIVQGAETVGGAPAANPIGIAFTDGSANRRPLTDTSGRQRVVGGAAADAAPGGDPVLVCGYEASTGVVRRLPVNVGGGSHLSASLFAMVGGTDGNQARGLLLDIFGRAQLGDTTKATYSAGASFSPVATTPGDVVVIGGSGTKTIIVRRLEFSLTGGAATQTVVSAVKRSTADSGGTPAAANMVPHHSTDSAATASVNIYTANPTPGTSVGNVRTIKYLVTTGTGAQAPIVAWDFSNHGNKKGIVLSGTAQQLVISLNGTTLTTPSMDFSCEWTEE